MVRPVGSSFTRKVVNSSLYSGMSGGNQGFNISWPKTNSVAMTHYTKPLLINNRFLGGFLGNISFIVTTQLNDAETFYSFSNIGNSGASYGVGVNAGNWFGVNGYVSSNLGVGIGVQVTPWATVGAEVSVLDGITISGGSISGNISEEVSVNVGWGTIAGAYLVSAGIAALPVPGARVVAGATAIVILLIDILN